MALRAAPRLWIEAQRSHAINTLQRGKKRKNGNHAVRHILSHCK
jgi:hypothetical protein